MFLCVVSCLIKIVHWSYLIYYAKGGEWMLNVASLSDLPMQKFHVVLPIQRIAFDENL